MLLVQTCVAENKLLWICNDWLPSSAEGLYTSVISDVSLMKRPVIAESKLKQSEAESTFKKISRLLIFTV